MEGIEIGMAGLFGQAMIQALGWTLLHFIWQGALVALLLSAALLLARGSSAPMRYGLACSAMMLMAALAGATFWAEWNSSPAGEVPRPEAGQAGVSPALPLDAGPAEDRSQGSPAGGLLVPGLTSVPFSPWAPLPSSRLREMARQIPVRLPLLVVFYTAGVALLSLRLLGGWVQANRLRRRAASSLPALLQARLGRLAGRLNTPSTVRFLRSAAVRVPTAVGWLRPVVLLPVSALAGLSPQQLEAIVAHELAHIRRRDYLVNLLQRVVETLLFYHPAVWWVSRQIRLEREHCCDDLAVQACGDALGYAKALARLERLRPPAPASAISMAADGGSLLQRVRRLVSASQPVPGRISGPLAALAVLGLMSASLLATGLSLSAVLQQPTLKASQKQLKKPAGPLVMLKLKPLALMPAQQSKKVSAPLSKTTRPQLLGTLKSLRMTRAQSLGTLKSLRMTRAQSLETLKSLKTTRAQSLGTLKSLKTTRAQSLGTLKSLKTTRAQSLGTLAGRSLKTIPVQLFPSVAVPLQAATPLQSAGPVEILPWSEREWGRGQMRRAAHRLANDKMSFFWRSNDTMMGKWRQGSSTFLLEASGQVQFGDDDRSLRFLSPGGYLAIQEVREGSKRRYEAEAVGGRIKESIFQNSQASRSEAEQWMAQAFLAVMRRTAIGAQQRVERILAQEGIEGVYGEIDLLTGDSARSAYFRHLIESGELDAPQMGAAVSKIGQEIQSDGNKTRVLIQISAHFVEDLELTRQFLEASRTISSDGDRRRLLSKVLERPGLDDSVALLSLRSIGEISSDGDKASLLMKSASRFALSEGPAARTYFEVLQGISSDGDQSRVLLHLMGNEELSREAQILLLDSARHISSDGDLSRVLTHYLRDYPIDEGLSSDFFRAVDGISSSGDRSRVLTRVSRQRGLSKAVLLGLLESAQSISSDGDLARLLVGSAQQCKSDQELLGAYRRLARKISSDGDYRRVMRAVGEGGR
ncbi:MAG: M56 family metallopeptidase [Acidobacteriota bacterium]